VTVNGGGWILKVVMPVTLPIVAEMVVVPSVTPVAKPLELIDATVVFDEAQVA
jgi:hypothetical protein